MDRLISSACIGFTAYMTWGMDLNPAWFPQFALFASGIMLGAYFEYTNRQKKSL